MKPGRRHLSHALLAVILVAGALLALLATGAQLYADYHAEMRGISSELDELEGSAVGSLANSVWTFNEPQIRLQLAGLLRSHDVEFVEVRPDGGSAIRAGEHQSARSIERQYELHTPTSGGQRVGTLTVSVGLDGLQRRITQRGVVLLLTEMAKMMLIALLLLVVFNRWVARHLTRMAEHARALKLDRLGSPLNLARRRGREPDELDEVADALNEMSVALAGELGTREKLAADRARLFEAYRSSRSLLDAIVENAPAVIFVRDLDSRYLLVNQRYREAFCGGEDVVGRTTQEVLPDRSAAIQESDQRVIELQAPIEYAFQSTEGGTVRDYLGQKFPLRDSDGRLFAIGCIAAEVTELRRAQEELTRHRSHLEELVGARTAELKVARDRAEVANRAKSSFLASMSHELRSPLNAMLGFSRLLGRDEALSPRSREDLGVILRSGEHLYGLINQVLEMAKIEAGHMELTAVPFDLRQMLDDLRDLFAMNAQAKGLGLSLELLPGTPVMVKADEVKLRQILINLVNNGLKFTVEGSVRLLARAKGTDANGRWLLNFTVTDTGAGIAPADLERLGQAFEQTQSGRLSTEGTGLGLAISCGYAELMGGGLTLHSELHRGTVATLEVPVEPVVDMEPPRPRHSHRKVHRLKPGQPPQRILVVDDSVDGRQLLMRLLRPMGFELREAVDGRQAVAQWRAWQPHLIFMDIRMPVMDGLEATQHIRTGSDGAGPVIVALTASAFEEQRASILRMGCDDFLRKPFKEEALFDVLVQHLQASFEYEDEESAADATGAPNLDGVPEALRLRLLDALERLDVRGVESAIEAVSKVDARAAHGLSAMASRYEYEGIGALLKTG